MDILVKALIIVVIIIAFIAVVRYAVQVAPQQISQSQAIANVTHFLRQSTPIGTVINITSVTPSQYSGSWHIVAGVVINGTSPCPSYYVDSFDYPQFGFVPGNDNNYTANCIINGLNKSYVIGYYPVAIARSYQLNLPQVKNYVQAYGYKNIQVQANQVPQKTINGVNYTNVWIVYYTAPSTTNAVQVYLQPNGTVITTT